MFLETFWQKNQYIVTMLGDFKDKFIIFRTFLSIIWTKVSTFKPHWHSDEGAPVSPVIFQSKYLFRTFCKSEIHRTPDMPSLNKAAKRGLQKKP